MIVTFIEDQDREEWAALWSESVDGALSPEVMEHSYAQIKSGAIQALVAKDTEGRLTGLLHFVVHPVAGCMYLVCYMQDLYVTPNARRTGVASALLDFLKKHADAQNYDRVYWLLDNQNKAAKEFYKGLGVGLDFGLYMIPVRMRDRLHLDDLKTASQNQG